MAEEAPPKKRGRKPLPPEEKVKRGRKKVVHQDIMDRKQQGAPPLQISFLCDEPATGAATSTSSAIGNLNPFADMQTSEPVARQVPKQSSRLKKSAQLTALAESDDDEAVLVTSQARLDVSSLSGEKCVELLAAHTDRKLWPSETETCCWNCTFGFQGIPISIPSKIHRPTGTLLDCFGVFCSFNCARRYCLTSNRHDSWQQMQFLGSLHKSILGKTAKVALAPPFQVLERFGGYMRIEEYRNGSITLPPTDDMFDPTKRRDQVMLLQKKCIPLFQTVIHSHNQQLITDSIQEKKVRKEGYERTKPLPGSQNLSNSMGINKS
jgi:hypothetical protein